MLEFTKVVARWRVVTLDILEGATVLVLARSLDGATDLSSTLPDDLGEVTGSLTEVTALEVVVLVLGHPHISNHIGWGGAARVLGDVLTGWNRP